MKIKIETSELRLMKRRNPWPKSFNGEYDLNQQQKKKEYHKIELGYHHSMWDGLRTKEITSRFVCFPL